MSELNVCLINDSFPPAIDGVANAVTNYAGIIEKSYGHATVVTPFYPEADDSVFDFPVIRYPSLNTTKMVGYRAGMPFDAQVMDKLEQANFDIIHTHCPITSTMLARSLRDRIQVPVVFTYHTKFDIDIANAMRSKYLQERAAALLAENISACDEVWCVSKGAGENMRKLGYQGDYIVMPNGVDLPCGKAEESMIEEVTAGFDLPREVPVFLFVGRMMWYKGIRIILDSLKKLQSDGIPFRMVFVGGGSDKKEIIEYCASLEMDNCVFFADPVYERDRIRAWYCRADLFLFPSTFDTNGLVVREAAAAALGSILISGSCAAEDVTDNVNGFLIEENAESMAAKLKELCARPKAMKEIGDGAQRDLYMSWDESVARAYERYGIVLDNFRAGKYGNHNKLTDEFFHATAESLDIMIWGYKRMSRKKELLNAGADIVREDLKELREELRVEIEGNYNHYLELKDELKADINLYYNQASEAHRNMQKKMQTYLEEYYGRYR